MRRHVVTALLPMPTPEPEYDLYQEIRKDAEGRSRGPISPATVQRMQEVAQRRGYDWCTAVLGFSYPGIMRISTPDGWTLIIADELRLDPPLPTRIVEERKAAEKRRADRDKAEAAQLEAAQEAWRQLSATAPVPLTVHENTKHTGPAGSLRHLTAAVDLVSGRARQHKAGAGLCETVNRPKPLCLGDAVDLPPTCKSCKKYAAEVRTLDAPAPPTAAEKRLLELIKSGVVATLRPGFTSYPTIRDTSHRPAPGRLGRKVDAQVERLKGKGWVVKDEEPSRTETGQVGELWRLTEAGTTALEG
ncbi:hypothetical protein ABZ468_08060 [Streptomyces sp. NPDC005708]|uniref:hypothetical protein n=1 Tax=Streptomyces sp. NPDC005708 TaxID=3154564 RepID=UPI0033E0AEE9